MKPYKLIFPVLVAGMLTGCGKWLDVTPGDVTTEKMLFSNHSGYYSAINGIYQTLSSPELYGENLTWGFLSALSQYYDSYNSMDNLAFSYTERYDYASEEMQEFGEEIWSNGYFAIANCNNVLKNLESADPSIFPYAEYGEMDVLKAECIALRALVHFDLLRLFAEAPSANQNAMGIPYSKTFPDKFPQRLSVSQVLENVISDFEEAANLLAPFDSVGGVFGTGLMGEDNKYTPSNSSGTGSNGKVSMGLFYSARGFHMNYVAVESLLARAYAYSGDMEAAYKCASELKKVFFDEQKWYKYTTFSSISDKERLPHKMTEDIVVAFYKSDLINDYSTSAIVSENNNAYKLKKEFAKYWFADDADDYRGSLMTFSLGGSENRSISLKYTERTESSSIVTMENRLLPVMRFSELALIIAEYNVAAGDIASAVNILNELRTARGCKRQLDVALTAEQVNDAIRTECLRENIAEGQYFFFCKRKNLDTINDEGVNIPMKGKYTMTIPDSELLN